MRSNGRRKKVMTEIGPRLSLSRTRLGPSIIEGKKAIITDDGLASGYTMLAAIKSLRRRGTLSLVSATPVASSHGFELIRSSADEVVAPIVSSVCPFAVAGFYRNWRDLTDEEVIGDSDRYGKAVRRDANAA